MTQEHYFDLLVREIHSVAAATIGADNHPQIRVIDMMLWDELGIYFLTAAGKDFYAQLMEQRFIALTGIRGKASISLRGKVQNIGGEKRDDIFLANPYMQKIYPGDTRSALSVFRLYEAHGEYFDISDPSHIVREPIQIGTPQCVPSGYFAGADCIGCKLCYSVCPQKCIDLASAPVVIDQSHCLRCGRCSEICPKQCIVRRGTP